SRRASPLYDPSQHLQLVYALDPKAAALVTRSRVLWALGSIDHALEISRKAVEHARSLGDPFSGVVAMVWAAWLRLCRPEAQVCGEQADAAVAYAGANELQLWTAIGLKFRGCALVEQGSVAQGIADLEQGFALSAALLGGDMVGDSYMYAALSAAK